MNGYRFLSGLVLAVLMSIAIVAKVHADNQYPELGNSTGDWVGPVDVDSPLKTKNEAKWVLLPVPGSNPTIGTGLSLIGVSFFHADAVSQPSAAGVSAGYFSSHTRFIGAGGLLNMAENRWRVSGGAAYIEANYEFYGVGSSAGNGGVPFPIRQTGTAAIVKVQHLLGEGWYLGAGFRYFNSQVGLRTLESNPEIEEILQSGIGIVSSGMTLNVSYDTRDLTTNPRTGTYIVADTILPSKALGSSRDYQRIIINASRYWPLAENHILAGRIVGCRASGATPFFDLCQLGSKNGLRGYPVGRYQDQSMLSMQGEWRIRFTSRWGMVLFGGVGEVAPKFGEINANDLLPSVGIGVRWMAEPVNKVNVSADIAQVKAGESAFYLYLGESF